MSPLLFRRCRALLVALLALVAVALECGRAWAEPPSSIRGPADEAQRVRLKGHVRNELHHATDLGPVDARGALHLKLQLRRSEAQVKALALYLEQLHDPRSPNFHHWLTPAEFGERFGASTHDVEALAGWLRGHGFTINLVYPNRSLIDFSGTSAQVKSAFRTEIRRYAVDGAVHYANATDPEVPAAFSAAIAGVLALHDFQPVPLFRHARPRPALSDSQAAVAPKYATGSGAQIVVPADLARIYNIEPLHAAGVTGQGQTIAVVGISNLYDEQDWHRFRDAFGLASAFPSGSLTTIHPFIPNTFNNCIDPGTVPGYATEAAVDAEWATAAAPGAAIVLATCTDLYTAFVNLIHAPAPPAIVSLSYGQCELLNGPAANAAYAAAYEQAVAQGISVFVAAGDSGSAMCGAGTGTGVNALASTPHNVAVGGTDFGDVLLGDSGSHWASSNAENFRSALGYVPEIAWNDSCASVINATRYGYASPLGQAGFCNAQLGLGQLNRGGGGGPSACAFGSPAPETPLEVSGTCAGHPKPSWQSGVFGASNDGVRGVPDVAVFAGDGLWGRYYAFCWSDVASGGSSCGGDPSTWSGGGGTSFATPIMSGIQALINQKWGTRQGNPNYRLYAMGAAEYGVAGNAGCNASLGAASGCAFHDVTLGENTMPCLGGNDCYVLDGPPLQPPSSERYDAATGTWTGAQMAAVHAMGTLTALPDGTVLAAGGFTDRLSNSTGVSEIYHPATRAWTVTGSLATDRFGHGAAALSDGRVLAVGGTHGVADTIEHLFASRAEIYDPSTGSWSDAGAPLYARLLPSVVRLQSGSVLVAAGLGLSPAHDAQVELATAEIFDPATGQWTQTGSLQLARYGQTATLLANGKVLVAGGSIGGLASSSAELFNPATGAWTPAGAMMHARAGHTATLLADGRVLVTGGGQLLHGGELAYAEIFDPATGLWNATNNMQAARAWHTASRLADGTVLVAGGYGTAGYLSSAERYQPATGTWSAAPRLARGRQYASSTTLQDGGVLVAGGWSVVHGVTSTDSSAYQPAFRAGPGWDFATGLGTLDALRVVMDWGPSQPLVSTLPASGVTAASAIVHGLVNARGATTVVSFEYGDSPAFGHTAAALESPLASTASEAAVSAQLGGLAPCTYYYFRVVGNNGTGGNANGETLQFRTTGCVPVTVALGADATHVVYGQSVTLTATVTGGIAPTGNVLFVSGFVPIGQAPLIGGVATLPLSPGAGTYDVTALYQGNAQNDPAPSGAIHLSVDRASTTLQITQHAPDPSVVGAPIAIGVALSVVAPGAGAPTGTIDISDGAVGCVVTLPATGCVLVPTTAGDKNLTAHYAGTSNFQASTAMVAHRVVASTVESRVTVTRLGSGNGSVASNDGSFACATICTESRTNGTQLVLIASPAPGSTFTGWQGACFGKSTCTVTVTSATSISATFAADAAGPFNGDIDRNGSFDALTDGIILIRALFDVGGAAALAGAVGPGATRTDPAAVIDFVRDVAPLFDFDGDGVTDALSDGLLFIRYLFGLRGAPLIHDALGAGATRTTPAAIEAAIEALLH